MSPPDRNKPLSVSASSVLIGESTAQHPDLIGKYGAANRLSLNYRSESTRFAKLDYPIIDCHTHLYDAPSALIYKEVAQRFGIGLTYSMTPLAEIESVSEVLGDQVRFIAMPAFTDEMRFSQEATSYRQHLAAFYRKGARIVKFWAAPRGVDIGIELGRPDLLAIDSARREEIMQNAAEMGMAFLAHVGDPDTWFQTKYRDAAKYGSKRNQYHGFEKMLDKFSNPWIAAHMGGWPEDLSFLSELLARHSNLYMDTSATKWMVRELSKHGRSELHEFFDKWQSQLLFGSDIVAREDQLIPTEQHLAIARGDYTVAAADAKASTVDLYSSRYWALRTLFETEYDGESPIADPDLMLIDRDRYTELDAPELKGFNLPATILKALYFRNADRLLEPYFAK